MRCFALAEALEARRWNVRFAATAGTADVVPAAVRNGVQWIALAHVDWPSELGQVLPSGCDALVVDHYGLDARYETQCRSWAKRIVAIDDLANRRHDCELLIDSSPGRTVADYGALVSSCASCLLGPHVAPIRREFTQRRRASPRRIERLGRILVAFGSTDSLNATEFALRGILASELAVRVDVVLGHAAPHLDAIARLAEESSNVRLHVEPDNLIDLMLEADLAVGAGGGSAWERCCLGLPSLIVTIAENQEKIAQGLDRIDAARWLGRMGSLSSEAIALEIKRLSADTGWIEAMSAAALAACDGRGADRIAAQIAIDVAAADGSPVAFRPVTADDSRQLYEWQSHPVTRRYARNPAVPTYEEHEIWLGRKLKDPGCEFYIILYRNRPSGVLRLDRTNSSSERYEVSISVAPERARMGLGHAALSFARALLPEASFLAEVLLANEASHALFQSAGYRRISDARYELEPVG